MKNDKVVLPPVRQTKVGYTPILRTENYGERDLDVDNSPVLFETEAECLVIYAIGEDDCIAIAKVIWQE